MATVRQVTIKMDFVNGSTTGIENVNKRISESEKRISSVSSNLSKLGNKFSLYVGVPSALAFKFAIKSAIDFEDKITDVQKVVDGLDTKEKLDGFAKQISEMSKKIPISRDGLAEMAAAAGQSGIALSDMQSFLDLSAKTMVAFDMTAQDAGKSLALMKANLNLSIPDLKEYIGQINLLGDSTNATERDIIEVLTRIASTGVSLGLAKEETLGLSAAMLNLGVSPERASTALTNLMMSAKEQQKTGESLIDTTTRLFSSLDKIGNEKERLSVMQKLFGSGLEMVNIDKMRNYFKTIKEGGSSSVDIFKKLKDSSGQAGAAMESQFGRKLGTAKSQLQLFKNELTDAAGELGKEAMPIILKIAKVAGNLLSHFSKLPEPAKEFVAALLGVAVVVGPILKITSALSKLTQLTIIANSLKMMAKNPVMAIAGMAAVGGGAYLANKYLGGDEESTSNASKMSKETSNLLGFNHEKSIAQNNAPLNQSSINNSFMENKNSKAVNITNNYNIKGDANLGTDSLKEIERMQSKANKQIMNSF